MIPLGNLESFLVNFTPTLALAMKHTTGRSLGYTQAKQMEKGKKTVKDKR